MNIIGLDLSLTSTGFATEINRGIIATTTKGAERLALLSLMVMDIVKEFDKPIVIVEGYSFASRNSQAHALGELGGVVRMRLWENGVPFIEVPPTCRAKFATGRGNASKTEVTSAISAKTGIVFSGSGANDICDAWILREMGLTHLGLSTFSWTQVQRSALDKIDWGLLMVPTDDGKEICEKQSDQPS